jgi:hypothetical protein
MPNNLYHLMPVLTRFKDLHGCLVPRKKQNHPDNRVVMAPGKAQPMRNIRAIIQREAPL